MQIFPKAICAGENQLLLMSEFFALNAQTNAVSCISISMIILFPETRAIARARAGIHASRFTCAIYRTREIIVFSRKGKFFIEGFSVEHNYKILQKNYFTHWLPQVNHY